MRLDHSEVRAIIVAVWEAELAAQVQHSLRQSVADGEFTLLVTKPDKTLPPVCTRFRPCVVVTEGDLLMSETWIPELRRLAVTDTAILALTADRSETTSLRLLHLGCAGLLDTRSLSANLPRAVSCLLKGEYWVNRRLLSLYCRSLRAELQFGVSKREREIWELIAAGSANNAIAERLCVSPQTIHWHIRGLYRKIGAASRQQAIRLWFGFDAATALKTPSSRNPSGPAAGLG